MENRTDQFYESPEIKFVEIEVRGTILVASTPNSADSYDRETW